MDYTHKHIHIQDIYVYYHPSSIALPSACLGSQSGAQAADLQGIWQGQKLITKAFAEILLSRSFSGDGSLKEPTGFPLWVLTLHRSSLHLAEITGGEMAKATCFSATVSWPAKGKTEVIESMYTWQNDSWPNTGNKEMCPWPCTSFSQ